MQLDKKNEGKGSNSGRRVRVASCYGQLPEPRSARWLGRARALPALLLTELLGPLNSVGRVLGAGGHEEREGGLPHSLLS